MLSNEIAIDLPDGFLGSLKSSLPPERLFTDVAQCWAYGFDNSRKQATPQAVVLPVSHDEVVAITRLCNQYKVPLVLRGRGTGTTGGSVPVQGGLVMSMEQMNQILEVDRENRLMRVEPGVTRDIRASRRNGARPLQRRLCDRTRHPRAAGGRGVVR